MNVKKLLIAFSLFVVAASTQSTFAQGLNWEGQTGAVLTPFAYTAASPAHKFGKPEVAFHYLNAGNVIGNDYQFSITEGFGKRFEAGLTQSFSSGGKTGLSPVFAGGYSTLHGKLTVVPENVKKTKWVPAIAVGAVGRFDNHRVNWYLTAPYAGPGYPTETSGDFYIVATKTITQLKVPIILNFGEKLTNASISGVIGQAGNGMNTDQRWQGRLFGAAAFAIKGPAKSVLAFGSEAAQQPRYVQPLGNIATIPTTLSYFISVIPHMEGSPLRFDVAVIQAAGKINPELDLNVRARVGAGVSYHF
ncbi:MAG: hypothetical protein CXZ00_06290 [Acidobacteria bacterium]|nr:MAG: hypothetical protein CXZ00_06290 [Acidobacteriota bacterium]